MQLFRREVCERHTQRTTCAIELPHEDVVKVISVGLSGLELEGAIVSCEIARKSDKHLSERRVDIKVELALEVMGAEFAEAAKVMVSRREGAAQKTGDSVLCFVPGDDG